MKNFALIVFSLMIFSSYSQEVVEMFPPQQIDVEPEFPGGASALVAFIDDNIEYPQNAKDQGLEGTVNVLFTVDETGKVLSVNVASESENSLDKEAIRIVESMPDWIPGEFQGKPVSVKMTLPIHFEL